MSTRSLDLSLSPSPSPVGTPIPQSPQSGNSFFTNMTLESPSNSRPKITDVLTLNFDPDVEDYMNQVSERASRFEKNMNAIVDGNFLREGVYHLWQNDKRTILDVTNKKFYSTCGEGIADSFKILWRNLGKDWAIVKAAGIKEELLKRDRVSSPATTLIANNRVLRRIFQVIVGLFVFLKGCIQLLLTLGLMGLRLGVYFVGFLLLCLIQPGRWLARKMGCCKRDDAVADGKKNNNLKINVNDDRVSANNKSPVAASIRPISIDLTSPNAQPANRSLTIQSPNVVSVVSQQQPANQQADLLDVSLIGDGLNQQQANPINPNAAQFTPSENEEESYGARDESQEPKFIEQQPANQPLLDAQLQDASALKSLVNSPLANSNSSSNSVLLKIMDSFHDPIDFGGDLHADRQSSPEPTDEYSHGGDGDEQPEATQPTTASLLPAYFEDESFVRGEELPIDFQSIENLYLKKLEEKGVSIPKEADIRQVARKEQVNRDIDRIGIHYKNPGGFFQAKRVKAVKQSQAVRDLAKKPDYPSSISPLVQRNSESSTDSLLSTASSMSLGSNALTFSKPSELPTTRLTSDEEALWAPLSPTSAHPTSNNSVAQPSQVNLNPNNNELDDEDEAEAQRNFLANQTTLLPSNQPLASSSNPVASQASPLVQSNSGSSTDSSQPNSSSMSLGFNALSSSTPRAPAPITQSDSASTSIAMENTIKDTFRIIDNRLQSSSNQPNQRNPVSASNYSPLALDSSSSSNGSSPTTASSTTTPALVSSNANSDTPASSTTTPALVSNNAPRPASSQQPAMTSTTRSSVISSNSPASSATNQTSQHQRTRAKGASKSKLDVLRWKIGNWQRIR